MKCPAIPYIRDLHHTEGLAHPKDSSALKMKDSLKQLSYNSSNEESKENKICLKK